MIRSFKGKISQAIAAGERPRSFPPDLVRAAQRKLFMIDHAVELKDLLRPPGNRLEALKGDRAGQHSIRINDRFRICFHWSEGGAEDVEITDYHRCPYDEDTEMLTISPPIHPGEILREEFLVPLALKPYSLAKELHVPRTRIERLAAEKSPVTPDTALRLAKFFGTTPQFWMNMQAGYDLAIELAAKKDDIASIRTREAA